MNLVRAVILLFSILLLTQSIFGSPFKQNNHVKRSPGSSTHDTEIQGRQGSSSISAFKEGEEKNNRRVAVLGAPLGSILKTILDSFGSISRKVAIGVINNSGYDWKAINAFIKHGSTTMVLPREVPNGGNFTYGARKTSGYGIYGAEGVLAYHIPAIQKTLAVMFSVPFNYLKYKNRVDVMLYEGRKNANQYLWQEMYHSPIKYQGDPQWYTKDLDRAETGIRAEFAMSTSGEATIEMKILSREPLG